ncbi:MAG: IS1595 family transposase [Acidimicrobiales bacterium]
MATPGVHFPASEREFRSWFQDDNDCLDYLDWLRWGGSRVCTQCGVISPPREVSGRVWRCPAYKARVSRTAGTIFQDTRTPLTTWFVAAWELCMDKGGVSALTLKRRLELGSYQTAWTMLHRHRSAMKLAGREKLSGRVEVDETMLGGPKPGKRGRGADGKVIVAVAVELKDPKGFGRVRLRVIPDTTIPTLRKFLKECVEPGSTIVTDGANYYPGATKNLYTHEPYNVAKSGQPANELLPAVHRVASLMKRWLMGTYQGSYGVDHVDAYLDEFTFRFNRRRSSARGLLFYRLMTLSAQHAPVHYEDIVQNRVAKPMPPIPPSLRNVRSRSLALSEPGRPWRNATPMP